MHHDDDQGAPLLNIRSDEQKQAEQPTQGAASATPQLHFSEQDLQKEIIHKILLDDSLDGLSLQYGVSVGRIKQRNNLHSNDIYFLKELVIPDPTCNVEGQHIDPAELLRLKQEYAINGFMNELQNEDRSYKVARYYLEQADWDIYKAAAEYADDIQWQRDQAKQPNGTSPVIEEYRRHLQRTLNLKNNRLAPVEPSYRSVELVEKKLR